jgi:hypothetical protein
MIAVSIGNDLMTDYSISDCIVDRLAGDTSFSAAGVKFLENENLDKIYHEFDTDPVVTEILAYQLHGIKDEDAFGLRFRDDFLNKRTGNDKLYDDSIDYILQETGDSNCFVRMDNFSKVIYFDLEQDDGRSDCCEEIINR